MFKMPERKLKDGIVHLDAGPEDDELTLTVGHENDTQSVRMSDYNAARVLALLAFRLGIKLPPDVRIKL